MSNFLKHVGIKIRLFWNMQGLTQEELAEKAGLQYSYIGGVERGERNISLETLKKITDDLTSPYMSYLKLTNWIFQHFLIGMYFASEK